MFPALFVLLLAVTWHCGLPCTLLLLALLGAHPSLPRAGPVSVVGYSMLRLWGLPGGRGWF